MAVHGVLVSHGAAGRTRRSVDKMQIGSLVHLDLQLHSTARYLLLHYLLTVADLQAAVG